MEKKTRETTRARCYNFLAMNCDGLLKTKASKMFNWKEAARYISGMDNGGCEQ